MGDSNYKKGQIYEQLTRDIVEKYLTEISLNGEVQWDVTLDGASGATHQIDVLIAHSDGSISIIECKNYDSNVCQEKIQSFATVKDDLKQSKIKNAYFFTKTGFQSGAIKIAKKYGIKIKNLKEYDREADYAKGRIKKISAKLGILVKTKFDYSIYDSKGHEMNGSFFFDGDREYHRSELYNYFGIKKGFRVHEEGNYMGTFDDLSSYEMKDPKTGIIVDSFKYDVEYKSEEVKMFEIDDSMTTHVVIDSENNKIQFLDEQLGLIEKNLK